MRRFYMALLGGLAAVGCGGGSKSSGPPMITAVVISNDSTVALAGTRELTATATAGGSAISNGVTFQWSSTDTTRATVSNTGLVSGVRRGTTDITAQAVLNGTATGIVSPARAIRVRIAGIVVTPASPAALNFVTDTQRFAAEPRDAAGAAVPGLALTWSSNNAVLSVAASGLATAVGRTNSNGVSVKIRATADGVTDSSVAILVRQIPVTATLNPNSFSTLTSFGQSVSASCVVVDSANDTIPAKACTWAAVPDTGVVTFSPVNAATTTITARKNGDANIQATAFAGIFAPNFVRVRQAPVRVKLHPTTIDTSRITTTGSMQFIDSVFDANDSLIRNPAPSVTWSSSGAAASVDGNGLVTASSAGNTIIKAVGGTGRDSARIEVVTTAITLSGNVQPIFTTNCARCHNGVGSALPGVQNLTAGNSRGNTVNVPSIESGLVRILPSRPDSSYLVHKIQGTHLVPPARGSGERMPQGCVLGSCLSQGTINIIRNWILQGALAN